MIDRQAAEETITSIIEMASTLMLKSVVQIGYMKELYSKEDYEKLFDA